MLSTTTEQQKRLLVLKLLGELLDAAIELKNLLELLRDLTKTLHNLNPAVLLAVTVLGERQGEHDHADELRGVGLGGSDTNFGTSVDVDTAVGHHGDGGTDNVDNTNGQSTTLQAVAESHERVGSLTGLGDEDASVVTEDGSLTIEEVGGQLDGNGDLGQLLEYTADGHAGMVRGTASNEDKPAAAADGGDVLPETTKSDGLVLEVETTTHSVDDGLWLLEDFLLHEVVEATLHDLLQLNLDGLDGTDVGSTSAGLLGQTVDVELTLVDVSNVVILEVENLLGVLNDGRWVGREEELGGHGNAVVRKESAGLRAVEQALVRRSEQGVTKTLRLLEGCILRSLLSRENTLIGGLNVHEVDLHLPGGADTDNQGRTLASSHNLMGVVDGLEEKTEGTLELLDDGLCEKSEVDSWVLIVDVFGELGDSLSVGLGLELETLALKKGPQLLVVGDDTIVDDRELPVGVRSGMLSVPALLNKDRRR